MENVEDYVPGGRSKFRRLLRRTLLRLTAIRQSNTGTKEGKEVVQLFISDVIASLTPDVKRLRGFDKISLTPGESKTISFSMPVNELAFVNIALKKQLEAGEFVIQVGKLTTAFRVSGSKVF